MVGYGRNGRRVGWGSGWALVAGVCERLILIDYY